MLNACALTFFFFFAALEPHLYTKREKGSALWESLRGIRPAYEERKTWI